MKGFFKFNEIRKEEIVLKNDKTIITYNYHCTGQPHNRQSMRAHIVYGLRHCLGYMHCRSWNIMIYMVNNICLYRTLLVCSIYLKWRNQRLTRLWRHNDEKNRSPNSCTSWIWQTWKKREFASHHKFFILWFIFHCIFAAITLFYNVRLNFT